MKYFASLGMLFSWLLHILKKKMKVLTAIFSQVICVIRDASVSFGICLNIWNVPSGVADLIENKII